MSESTDTTAMKFSFWLGVVAPIALPVAVGVIVLPALFLRAWVGTVLWGWFAPWPLSISLLQLVGLLLAYSVVFARNSHEKDERSLREKCVGYLTVSVFLPLCALSIGWLLTFWL